MIPNPKVSRTQIINLLKNKPDLDIMEIAKKLKVMATDVLHNIKEMEQEGIVKQKKTKGKYATWSLNPQKFTSKTSSEPSASINDSGLSSGKDAVAGVVSALDGKEEQISIPQYLSFPPIPKNEIEKMPSCSSAELLPEEIEKEDGYVAKYLNFKQKMLLISEKYAKIEQAEKGGWQNNDAFPVALSLTSEVCADAIVFLHEVFSSYEQLLIEHEKTKG